MTRKRLLSLLIGSISVMGLIAAIFVFRLLLVAPSFNSPQINNAGVELGFAYLPISQDVSAYYSLDVDTGALVTAVAKGGLIEKAGVKAGDIITGFNGTKIGADTPLLGMMRVCCIDDGVTLEVWSDNSCRLIEIVNDEIR